MKFDHIVVFAAIVAFAATSSIVWFYILGGSAKRLLRYLAIENTFNSSASFRQGNLSSSFSLLLAAIVQETPTIAITKELPRRTFWTSDLHDGTRVDTPSVLAYLNQTVIVNGAKEGYGHYPDVFKKVIIPGGGERSNVLFSHMSHSNYMSEKDIKENFEFYKDSKRIAETDAFICSFPAAFCEAWMPFNKSLIILPAHRFSLGRCSKAKLERLIEHIQAMNNSKSPKHFIAASSVYDAEYINYYTGVKAILLSSSAFFYAGHGVTKFTQARKEILVGPLQRTQVLLDNFIKDAVTRKNKTDKWKFATAKELYGDYKLQNVADHRAVVVLPYAVMSYGITELYAMEIPLLVPSINWLVNGFRILGDRSLVDPCYCTTEMAKQLPPKHPDSRHNFSPDTYDAEPFSYWLQFADFYQWPHITVFENFDDMIDKLETMNFEEIHLKMVEANKKREDELLNNWRQIIPQIETGRQVPKDYQVAIKELWHTDQLQVE